MDEAPVFPKIKSYQWNINRLLILLSSFLLLLTMAAWQLQPVLFSQQKAEAHYVGNYFADQNIASQRLSKAKILQKIEQRHKDRQINFWHSTYPFIVNNSVTIDSEDLPDWRQGDCAQDCIPPGTMPAWPLKPFYQPRPIISFLNDSRPGSMHHGIDITANDNQNVYAIQSGTAHIIEAEGYDARVQVGNYIYWHIYPTVEEGQYVEALATVVGQVQHGFGHLHFSEVTDDGDYIDPLRPGQKSLPGWNDKLAPVLGDISITAAGEANIDAYDRQSLRKRKPYITPVTNLSALAYALDDGPLQWAYRGGENYEFAYIDQVYADTDPAFAEDQKCYSQHRKCPYGWVYRLAGGIAPALSASKEGRHKLTVYGWDWDDNVSKRVYQITYRQGQWHYN